MARKLKHSKIKNTSILFELLTRQITADVLAGKSTKSVSILKKYFNENAELGKELELYKLLSEKNYQSEVKANDLLNVINVETNFTYSTNAQNPKSNAIGLIQFTKEGTDDKGDFKWIGKGGQIDRNKVYIEDIKTMNPIQQLELVDRYFDQMHVKNGYEHPSLTVAVGKKAQGKGMTDVLYHKGSREWGQNPNWRVNGTGPITRESILKHYDGLKKYG